MIHKAKEIESFFDNKYFIRKPHSFDDTIVIYRVDCIEDNQYTLAVVYSTFILNEENIIDHFYLTYKLSSQEMLEDVNVYNDIIPYMKIK